MKYLPPNRNENCPGLKTLASLGLDKFGLKVVIYTLLRLNLKNLLWPEYQTSNTVSIAKKVFKVLIPISV